MTIQRVIELTFADEDIEVTAVGDGQKAIQLISSDRPDIVLADVDMPERNGFEVASFVKSNPDLAHIRVVLLTGAFEPVDEDRVRAVGCDAVLAKPFEPQMLIARVKELLASAGKAAAAPAPAPVAPPARAAASQIVAPLGTPGGMAAAAAPAGMAAPPPGDADAPRQPVSLDEYFDQLDAAFASHGIGEPAPPAAPIEGAPQSSPGLPGRSSRESAAGVSEVWPSNVPDGHDWIPAARAHVPTTPTPQPVERVPDIPAAAVHAAPISASALTVAPSLAATFEALLAAEQGEPVSEGSMPRLGQVPAFAVDAIAEEVTAKVIARLGDRALREQVADLVSAVAERLVREEIERIKATVK